jgi:hypothetical protein
MTFISIEAEEYILKIHNDNFLEFIIREEAVLDVRVALEAKKIVEEYRPGIRFYVLAEGMGFFNVTKEARELSACKEYSSHMAAVAFHTTNPSMVFLGDLYNSINKPAVITKVFHSRYSAREWLQERMTEELFGFGKQA